MRRFLALIVSLSFLLSICSTLAYAEDITSQPVSFWDKCLYWHINPADESTFQIGPDFFNITVDISSIVGKAESLLSSNRCPNSDDNLHHVHHFLGESGEDGHGKYQIASCQYCGDTFRVYGQDVHDAYDTYLTDNNLDNGLAVDPEGGLIWYPTSDDLTDVKLCVGDSDYSTFVSSSLSSSFESYGVFVTYSIDSPTLLSFFGSNPSRHDGRFYCGWDFNFILPVPGSYFSNPFTWYWRGQNSGYGPYGSRDYSAGSIHGDYVSSDSSSRFLNFHHRDYFNTSVRDFYYSFLPLPSFNVVPSDSSAALSVPSTITIYNNDYSVKDFNFSTRTYNVTNDNGDDITIKYDDDNYTITNNTTKETNTYNYYITNNTGGGDTPANPDNSDTPGVSCDHTGIESRLDQVLNFLRQILDKITGKDNNLPVDVPDSSSDAVDPQKMPDFLFNFTNKFGFINDIYQITLQLVRDITNDKFTAYNYPDGVINLPELKSIHVPAPDQPGDDPSEGETLPSGDTPSGPGGSITGVSVPTAPSVSFMFPEYDFYGFNFGGYAVLDFSWYAPYKSRVDGLLSGFLWASFLWLLFKRLPGIIHGSAMAADTVNYIDNASNDKVLWGGS